MPEILQSTLDRAVLNKLFELAQRTDNQLRASEIAGLFDFDISIKRVEMSLEQLENDEMINCVYSTIEEATYAIDRRGYLTVEKGRQRDDSFDRLYAEFGDSWLEKTGGLETIQNAVTGSGKSAAASTKPYSEFRDSLLIALYRKSMAEGLEIFKLGDLATEFGVDYRPGWIIEAAKYFDECGYALYSSVMGGDEVQSAKITDEGMVFAEELLAEKADFAAMGLDETSHSVDKPIIVETASEAASTWDEAKRGSSWGSSWGGVPASDRVVPLNHNAPDYKKAFSSLEKVIKEFREDQSFGNNPPPERDRILRELEAGRDLMKEAELRPRAFVELVFPALKWLSAAFAVGLVGAAGVNAYAAISAWLQGLL